METRAGGVAVTEVVQGYRSIQVGKFSQISKDFGVGEGGSGRKWRTQQPGMAGRLCPPRDVGIRTKFLEFLEMPLISKSKLHIGNWR